jgi:peptide/nickel transport system substrate-binding protein
MLKCLSVIAFAIAAATAPALSQTMGGDLVVGLSARLAHPDPHVTTAHTDTNVILHIFEGLTALDDAYLPVPQLAESVSVSDDGLTYTFPLRQGVTFHNGDVMEAGDALASFERHKRVSPGRSVHNNIASIEAPDAGTIVITLKEPQPLFLELISLPQYRLAVMPAEDAAAEAGAVSGVGTGPYKFVDQVADSRVTLARFDEYVANASFEGPTGFGGKRTPYFDSITFRVAIEGAARVAGVQTGEMHIADNIPVQSANRLAGEAGLQVIDIIPFAKVFTILHTQQPPTDNLLVRRAIQAAINAEETLEVAMEGFYQLDHSFLFTTSPYHPGSVGSEFHNIGDAERAKALLAEAGYAGEPLRIMTNANYPFMENSALVLQQQLMAIGMTVEIEMVDWPTNVARRTDGSGGWNVTISSSTAQGPQTYFSVFKGYAQVESDPVLDEAFARVASSPELADRQQAWKDVEARVADQAYLIPSGDRGMKVIARDAVHTLAPYTYLRLWDSWLEQ